MSVSGMGINFLRHEKFSLPQLDAYIDMSGVAQFIGDYLSKMLDQTMN